MDISTKAQLSIPKIQFTDHMNLNKEHQSVDTSVLRRQNKLLMGGRDRRYLGGKEEGDVQKEDKIKYGRIQG